MSEIWLTLVVKGRKKEVSVSYQDSLATDLALLSLPSGLLDGEDRRKAPDIFL